MINSITMNYKKHYDLLINRGKNRMLSGYVERHHIIPKCLGGSDDIENLVQLTPEEHYVAHQLLMKMYPNVNGLAHAAQLMTVHHTDRRTTNKLFGWIRKKCGEESSTKMIDWHKENEHPRGMLGKSHTEEKKKQIAMSSKIAMTEIVGVRVYAYNLDGSFYKEFRTLTECAEHLGTNASNVKYTMEGKFGHCKGKILRDTRYEKVDPYQRKKQTTYERTTQHNKNTSERFMKMGTCRYCGLVARISNLARWHNDNCEHKL